MAKKNIILSNIKSKRIELTMKYDYFIEIFKLLGLSKN